MSQLMLAGWAPGAIGPQVRTDTGSTVVTGAFGSAPQPRVVWRDIRSRVIEERPFGKLAVLEIALAGASVVPDVKTLVYRPGAFSPDMPIVMVMHGISRNAWTYLEAWVGMAERYGFVLIIPEFPRRGWPTSREYNFGNVRTRDGKDRPVGQWSFTAVDTVFDAVRDRFALETEGYHLYGHSAGAQFVHRFLLHTGGPRVIRAAAANAGWYMLPDKHIPFPYGISKLAIDGATLRSALETPLTILLGEKDNDCGSPNLRTTGKAQAQGPHRLARGLHFIEVATDVAFKSDCRLRWRAKVVPNTGHSDRAMAPYACAALLGKRRRRR
ncbi:MAG: hypothetical protein ACR2PO_18680 [Methyloligellaceae bacterium]